MCYNKSTMRNTINTSIVYCLVSTAAFAAVAPHAKFEDGMLSKTRPAGWLGEACKLQSEGLTGHPEALSYPYDTCLWDGEIPRMGTHGQDWWRYEQTAYYVDGLLRLGYAIGDEAFIKKGEENVDYTLEHAAPDGHLGHPSLWDATRYKLKNGYDMWPLAVFFRAMKAKYDAAPDERIPAALQRNFLNYDKEHVSKVRNIVNVEGLLWTYERTGDKRLLDLAEEAWNMRQPLPPEKKNELAPKNCANNDAIHMHGVSYCEEMKVPMLLAAYTGKKEYFEQAVNVERKLARDHMLPDGCPTSAERTLGNNVHICHETCDVADYTWSLGYFLEATGDARYADKIERCVFNAGFGAVGGDFRSLQYFSNVNQFICTSNSDHNPQNYGTTWMQYRPTHETECCAGNVNRILPNYISRMWLKDAKGRPVAALYGPSEVDYGWAKIKEETRYPFDGKITFRFSVKEPTDSALTYRVPGWCKGVSVKVNGKRVALAASGGFATIERTFSDGDVVELDFPMEVKFEELPRRFAVDGKDVAKRLVKRPAAKFANSSQGIVVTRGPLLFSYPIPAERTEDVHEHANMNGKKSANPEFKSWNLKPSGNFNYALAARRAEVVGNGDAGDGFFRNPAGVKLRVSVKRIDWKLDENRFTPDLPERPLVLSDDIETIELVPYGATMLRLGAFPDVSKDTFAAAVWRGETAYVNIPAGVPVSRLVSQAKDGVAVKLGYYDEVAYEMQPGGVDIRMRPDVYREDGRRAPTVARVAVASDAKPGVYNFGPLEVTVADHVLPPAKDWKYFLDLWQHPWAVSRYFNVEPFSKEHYAKMEPIYRALAECGCKALTTTLLDLPWNHQCHDGYYTMVGRVKNADGSWAFDYKLFDEYVEFGRKCGLGPDIACYTMCPWKYMATWKDAEGNDHREKILPGTQEFEDYWGPFLVDFAAHMKAKGWFEDTYIAMDERGPEDVKKIVNLIQAKAPGMKVAICGKTKPSAFAGIQIENFCQGLIHLRDDFLPELAPRRAKGYKTTFYVCCTAKHPNTFMESPRDEGFYLGAYPVMIGFDGFLRWAANSWGEDPYKDASFRTKDWKAGDVFLVYPNGELSSRLVELRAGIVAAEKMTILRTNDEKGAAFEKRMADIAKRYHFFASVRDPSFDFEGFRREVDALVNDTAVHGNEDRAQLYMAGDSIMTEYKSDMFPQFGWGQALKSFMKEPASLHNFARSGWSARRFRESGRWEKNIASQLKPGDWVIVSFGHNDMNKKRNKPPKNDYSTIDEYKEFLKGFAADAKEKGANIAFATSIAHSSGFGEKDGVMSVDGGATGLGPYVAAMREVAAELNAPLLDLNRYAEENLPKMGLEKAKALYMIVRPGEYANYPDGKNDPAHIRDAGAHFYAKGAVEMARAQNVSLADLFKDPSSVSFVPSVALVASTPSQTFSAVSPNGKNELRLEVGGNGMAYSVWRSGKALVEPTRFSLTVEGRGTLNGAGMKPEATTRKVDGTLATPLYKKSSVDLAANETKVDFGDWAVRLHARNDGVAWRFETEFGDKPMLVTAESTTVRFPKGAELCYTVAPGFMSGWEKPAVIGPVESVPAGHPQIVMTPFTATVPDAGVVTVTESDLRDYPGLNFYRREGETDTLRSWQAGVPKDVDKGRRKIKVVNREPYLAKTKGTRSFPWRVFILGDSPSDLVVSDAVYALATPHSQLPTPNSPTDFSWVKPGKVAWDWWNGFKITDVPGLKTGCNFETYKEYVNFAAANGIEYIIMDEGWSEKLDLDNPREEVNVPGVIAYAKEKGVDVILWAAWAPLTDREARLRIFDRYAALGAKGFKIDFIERDDQDVEGFLEETAADAAERRLVVMYHGIHKPTGLQRTYPNILNYEGVYGLEQGGRSGGRKVVVSNDVNLVYTRMVAGFMDYTPGAMRNRAFDAPPYDKEKEPHACYGTRCHQLALFPLFEAPVQMLCDSPTQYRTAPECTAFIAKVPTVWDETVGVAGEIGKYAVVARRKGGEWWLGAITNWEARELELPTSFLGEGEWKVEAFEDAPDADKNAEHYIRREFTLKAGELLKVKLAPGGGFAAKFAPIAN